MLHQNKSIFRLAILLVILCFGYFYMSYLVPVPHSNKDGIIGNSEFMKNAMMMLIGFYFGASVKKQTN